MKTKKKKPNKWKPEFVITIYQLATEGLTNSQIASMIGIGFVTFNKWKKEQDLVKYALEQGRIKGTRKQTASIKDYIFGRLPKKLKVLWEKIDELENHPNDIQRLNRLFEKKGEQARKHLFLHALATSHFDPSEACRRLGIPFRKIRLWCTEDDEFAELIEEIHIHKKNFCESSLMRKVEEGDTQALLFVNKSLNKDRGYNDKQEVEVNVKGGLDHTHTIVVDERVMDLMSKSGKAELLNALAKIQRMEEQESEGVVPIGKGQQLLLGKVS